MHLTGQTAVKLPTYWLIALIYLHYLFTLQLMPSLNTRFRRYNIVNITLIDNCRYANSISKTL